MDELQNELNEHKGAINGLTERVRSLRDNPVALVCAREIALAMTKLQEAKMWLLSAIEAMGESKDDQAVPEAPAPQDAVAAEPEAVTPEVAAQPEAAAPVVETPQPEPEPVAPDVQPVAETPVDAPTAQPTDGQPQS